MKGAGNSINYKYRMHDPRTGRFFAIDPLAPKYPHNSPYAFSENRLIDAVELEGLEANLAIAGKGNTVDGPEESVWMKHPNHVSLFYNRMDKFRKYGYTVVQVETGQDIVQAFMDGTTEEGSVGFAIIASHGNSHGVSLFWDEGFYDKDWSDARSASTLDLKRKMETGQIKFEEDASVLFLSCNAGRENGLADSFTLNTGVTTIAASGSVGPVNKYDENGKKYSTGAYKTWKKEDEEGAPEGNFYKIERIEVERTIKIPVWTIEGKSYLSYKYKEYELKRTNLGKRFDAKEYGKDNN